MSRPYVLTSAAAGDLRKIIRHSRREWGDSLTRLYTANLERGMILLAQEPERGRDMGDLVEGLRMIREGRHCIFGLPRTGAPVLIVAILHERMNLLQHLADRLR